MSNPKHTLFWMAIYLSLVAALCVLLYIPLRQAFLANWGFNSLILGVLCIGVLINVRQVLLLMPELNWVKLFRTGDTGISVIPEPQLLKPLAKHLQGKRKDRFRLSAFSLRIVLDGIRERLDESREISRYIIGLLIFLGLLGTFWGLLDTISAVGSVISSLELSGGDVAAAFGKLKAGLEKPLAGMGTAFSSSLFGLGGSLILGFLDLQAAHAQNRFFNSLEEWLSSVTQLIDEPGLGAQGQIGFQGEIGRALLSELQAQRVLLETLAHGSAPAEAPEKA